MSTLLETIRRDVIASLPLATEPGRLFFSSDTGVILRDSGTAWEDVSSIPAIGVNAQTGTSYTVVSDDRAFLITQTNASPAAYSLPQATGLFGVGFWFEVRNIGVGTVTITAATSLIDGGASLDLATGESVRIISDGTDYQITALVRVDLIARVPTSRTISTTAPLTGGGDLSANRTLAISVFGASGGSHSAGAVPDPGSSAGTTKFLREDATFVTPAGSSPLTTKGDIHTYSTADDRLAVGSNGQFLVADSAEATGNKWHSLVAGDIPAIPESGVTSLVSDLALKAPLASPALTGTPTAPTASTPTNTTQIATTAFVKAQGYGTSSLAKYTTSWSSQTSVTVTHSLSTTAVIVQVFDAGGVLVVPESVTVTSGTVVTLTFGAAFTGSVVVIG